MQAHLFTVHNVAASGGSICSQFIAACTNSLLSSEIHPLGEVLPERQADQANLRRFSPGRPLDHVLLDSKHDLSNTLKLKSFGDQLELSIRHAASLGKNLTLREHTHSNFTLGGLQAKNGLLDFLSHQCNGHLMRLVTFKWPPILTVRHPLDNFLSARKKKWHRTYASDGYFETYCKALLEMQNYFAGKWGAVCLRYEDLCIDQSRFFHDLVTRLECPFLQVPMRERVRSVSITGKSGRRSNEISLRPRQLELVEDDLRRQVTSSVAYVELCKLNGYNSDINADGPNIIVDYQSFHCGG